MSEKKFEPCSLAEATHVEMGGKMYELGKEYTSEQEVLKYNDFNIEFCRKPAGWQLIHVGSFPVLGIKPMKKIKPEPIEFEATFAKYDGNWYPLHSLDDGVSYLHNKKAKFRCVEILEEKK